MQSNSSKFCAVLLVVLCLWLSAHPVLAVDADIMASLSAPAQEVAKDLDVAPSVERLLETERKSGKDSLDTLRLREQLVEDLVEASFEIRSALSRIDDDVSRSNELREVMEDRRESRVSKSNVANFINTGTADILSTSMTNFPRGTAFNNPAGVIGVVGGVLNIGISTYTLRLNQGEHLSHPIEPNMLSQVFGYKGPECQFPTGVWNYLNDPYPGTDSATETRRLHLIRVWVKLARISPPSTEAGKKRIGLLTGLVPLNKQLTIDLLEDRSLMLSDLHAAVSQMDTEMLEIMRWIKAL
jgi:hypothetical protein